MANPTGKGGRRFQKGQSGNPRGRPKQLIDIQALARTYTDVAVAALVEVCSTSRNDSARIAAANSLIDRGYGKAVQHVDAVVESNNTTTLHVDRPSRENDEQWLARRFKELNGTPSSVGAAAGTATGCDPSTLN